MVMLRAYADWMLNNVQAVDSTTASLVKELRIGRQVGVAVTMLRFHPENSDAIWASSAEGKVYAVNMQDGTCKAIITGAFSRDGQNDIQTDMT